MAHLNGYKKITLSNQVGIYFSNDPLIERTISKTLVNYQIIQCEIEEYDNINPSYQGRPDIQKKVDMINTAMIRDNNDISLTLVFKTLDDRTKFIMASSYIEVLSVQDEVSDWGTDITYNTYKESDRYPISVPMIYNKMVYIKTLEAPDDPYVNGYQLNIQLGTLNKWQTSPIRLDNGAINKIDLTSDVLADLDPNNNLPVIDNPMGVLTYKLEVNYLEWGTGLSIADKDVSGRNLDEKVTIVPPEIEGYQFLPEQTGSLEVKIDSILTSKNIYYMKKEEIPSYTKESDQKTFQLAYTLGRLQKEMYNNSTYLEENITHTNSATREIIKKGVEWGFNGKISLYQGSWKYVKNFYLLGYASGTKMKDSSRVLDVIIPDIMNKISYTVSDNWYNLLVGQLHACTGLEPVEPLPEELTVPNQANVLRVLYAGAYVSSLQEQPVWSKIMSDTYMPQLFYGLTMGYLGGNCGVYQTQVAFTSAFNSRAGLTINSSKWREGQEDASNKVKPRYDASAISWTAYNIADNSEQYWSYLLGYFGHPRMMSTGESFEVATVDIVSVRVLPKIMKVDSPLNIEKQDTDTQSEVSVSPDMSDVAKARSNITPLVKPRALSTVARSSTVKSVSVPNAIKTNTQFLATVDQLGVSLPNKYETDGNWKVLPYGFRHTYILIPIDVLEKTKGQKIYIGSSKASGILIDNKIRSFRALSSDRRAYLNRQIVTPYTYFRASRELGMGYSSTAITSIQFVDDNNKTIDFNPDNLEVFGFNLLDFI